MRVKEITGEKMDKEIQFQPQQGLNVNTQNSSNESRNSVNTDGTYDDTGTITATGKLLVNVNGQNYLIDVEKI